MSFVPIPLRDGPGQALGAVWARPFAGGAVAWEEGTAWVLVTEGRATLRAGEDAFPLRAGMFAVVPEAGRVEGGVGLVLVDRRARGLRQLGGPVEAEGRLRYIDGCTDTLLVCPARRGEPSLSHLHIPAGTDQTRHTHASDRVGVILRGRGVCRTPQGRTPLAGGMGWWIPAGAEHSFVTDAEPLDVLAWHPDSVFGPTDEVHPMILGTLVR